MVVSGAALLAVGAGLWLALDRAPESTRTTTPVAVVELVRGPVQLLLTEPDETTRRIPARPGREIPAGAVFDLGPTSDKARDGIAIRLSGGSSVRFKAGARAALSSKNRIDLERGTVYVDSRQGVGREAIEGEPVEVRTTFGVVRDIGTQFEVSLMSPDEGTVEEDTAQEDTAQEDTAQEDTVEEDFAREDTDVGNRPVLRVRVREGKVIYTAPTGSEHRAAVGEELRILASGGVERASAAIYGPHWQWVIDNAAVPEVEGRPLSVYLQWLEREGGWSLRYEEPSRTLADDTKLFGNIHGLSAEQATPMVFAGSGLIYNIEGGELVISKRRP